MYILLSVCYLYLYFASLTFCICHLIPVYVIYLLYIPLLSCMSLITCVIELLYDLKIFCLLRQYLLKCIINPHLHRQSMICI